jgi:hypothetical protein
MTWKQLMGNAQKRFFDAHNQGDSAMFDGTHGL